MLIFDLLVGVLIAGGLLTILFVGIVQASRYQGELEAQRDRLRNPAVDHAGAGADVRPGGEGPVESVDPGVVRARDGTAWLTVSGVDEQ